MQASVQRILALKEKWVDGMPEGGFDFDGGTPGERGAVAKDHHRGAPPRRRRPALGSAPLCIGCPAYRTSLGGECGCRRDEPLRRRYARALHGSAAAMQPEPGREEIAALVELARRHTSAVVGTFNGRLAQGPAGAGGPAGGGGRAHRGGGAARPYDLAGLPKACGRWRHSSIRSRAFGRLRACCAARPNPTGRLPVTL